MKKISGPSEKQLTFINNLCNNINQDPLAFATKLLERPIADLRELKVDETKRVINRLLGEQWLTPYQLAHLAENWPLEKLNRIFKSTFTDHSQLTKYHYDILMTNRFNKRCLDHPLENTPDYEYGWQEQEVCADGKLYYLKFYNLMMLDYDGFTLEQLKLALSKWTNKYSFEIYRTYNGFHVYLVSEPINYRSARPLMDELECDFFYGKFVYGNGFKIRLSPKLGREETYIEQYVERMGSLPTQPEIEPLLKIRERFLPGSQKDGHPD